MSNWLFKVLIITLLAQAELHAQPERYIVKVAPFSSRIYDEFSPVFFKDGVVFCSNQNDNSLVSFNDEQNRLFNIFYVTKKGNSGWTSPKILAKEITTVYNDGPVTFNGSRTIIHYSRNTSVEKSLKSISDPSNTLGIFSAELINGIWTNITPFTYNDPLYSFCTPALTPDGQRIYFASDMPGGSGGMDLYYCNRVDNDWDRPVNLGPVINTQNNESFPFVCEFGRLYFASDGHIGLGGKDLYYTREINGEWIAPVHLESPINSPADDFGIVLDSTLESGYFSTNRRKTDDIFSFRAAPVEFTECDSIKENNFCFTFYDERHQIIDTILATYRWDFGDGQISIGKEVRHCFPGPGNYTVKLSINDDLTGEFIVNQLEYEVELENLDQASIISSDVGMVDSPISFEEVTTDLKGIRITHYFWDFGDGFKSGSSFIQNTYKKKGEYMVKLGLFAETDSHGAIPKRCFMKKITIY
jgi:hypothetical protein